MPLSLLIPGPSLREKALTRYREFTAESAEGLPVVLKNGSSEHAEPLRDDSNFSYVLDDASMNLHSFGAEFHGVCGMSMPWTPCYAFF